MSQLCGCKVIEHGEDEKEYGKRVRRTSRIIALGQELHIGIVM